ncbi:MAG: gamma carbonic anhydrase family protein, partial [Gammaproteobacteria bacterium]|nr:gamma carbonic anhydrase family protein [Gammaproteobacteria bacterium]
KEIPDGSLVMGSPAKVVKTLTEQQQAQLEKSAEVYVAKSKQFKKDLHKDIR